MKYLIALAFAIVATLEPLKSPRFGYAPTAILAISAIYYVVLAAIEDSEKKGPQ